MSNVTVIQPVRTGNLKLLLASRIKQIISRADLATLTDLETLGAKVWAEKSEFGTASRRIREARSALSRDRTAENREKVDALEARYPSEDYCSKEEDLRYVQLREIEDKVPAAVYPVLRRTLDVLGDIRMELSAAAVKEFASVGVEYRGDADAGLVLQIVIFAIHELSGLTARWRRNQHWCFQFPSSALNQYLDLTTVKKESLAATLPVPVDAPEPPPYKRPTEPVFHNYKAGQKAPPRDIPGVTLNGYTDGEPAQFSSDGEFSKDLGRVATLPSKVL